MKRPMILGSGLMMATILLAGFYQTALAQGNSWGTIKGKVVWGGKEIPKQVPIPTVKGHPDQMACQMGGNVVVDETYVVNPKNKGLQWTFIWLAQDDVKNKGPLPIHPNLKVSKVKQVVLDQPLCAFIPHAIAMRDDQDLFAKNTAAIAHNLKWTGLENQGNVLIPAGQSFAIKGLKADRVPMKIECNIHPWMNGYVRIFSHPYYAVTNADGAFEIKDAPAGKYRVIVAHGEGGYLGGAKGKNGKSVEIKAGGITDLGDFVYPQPAP